MGKNSEGKKWKVYLAGAVGLDEAFVRGWREYAENFLNECGIDTLNPIKDREISPHYDPTDIVETDLEMVRQADIVLAEYSHDTYGYIGTSMEIREAYLQGKTIITWGDAYRNHYWLRYHANRCFGELEQALEYIARQAT